MAIKYTVFSKNYKCPACGYVYEKTSSTDPGKTYAKFNFRHYMGSPIRKCPKCGSNFIDSRYNEYLLMTPEQRNLYFNGYKSGGPIAWIIIILIYTVTFFIGSISSEQYSLMIGSGVGLLLLIIPISVRKSRKNKIQNHKFDNEIKNSILRFKNEDYIKQLLEYGFTLYPLSKLEIGNNATFLKENGFNNLFEQHNL